jgi:hypothetical protein
MAIARLEAHIIAQGVTGAYWSRLQQYSAIVVVVVETKRMF